jgi:hypothetical protein
MRPHNGCLIASSCHCEDAASTRREKNHDGVFFSPRKLIVPDICQKMANLISYILLIVYSPIEERQT